ncbi:uncharacterized protein LOC121972544 [Zingiber officinale]|uniref:uncharacterized protein LOC121972544 n=1 Tax=Zingiber officinale TaxID=94328 RepID=UPI001C4C762A|nr:uncharacterized protein LOC121972544 [Zingiber officinale]
MSLRCGVVLRPWSVHGSPVIPCRTGFPSVVAFNHTRHRLVGSDQLRIQLDQLRVEAEITRSKANNARLRLMRLTEAAENLQKTAAKSIQVGKENEARELLIQKKKLLQALEKSKNRIEVLDKLSAKAISLKETQLIGQVAIPPVDNQLDSHQQIHFISPNEETYEKSSSGSSETLLKHMFEQIDLKLCSVEADIDNFLSAQTEESKEVQVNAKLELCEILKDVLRIREK